ncbi:NAD-dependent epimerase/dehydratase family protein [Actinophytocola gossypii]|uniref:NAD-dependent epimerase/dehydratase family protein n=1 Tax=Actinophytocola gossypii TaxID=2812003 RepID=A0ABT2J910_9PSEU|nr:NAD-dependent epimerase/dehydratase family protein [Actinophytocola gossypii]MCT2584357.1 NAD-dependent epimerase/dehydratase family protein [Actinophytocola gossypii]
MSPGPAKRVVVTGASGNVGSSVLRELNDDPDVGTIVAIARRCPEWTVDKAEWAVADVATDDLVPLLAGADVVIHLAWLLQPARTPVTTWEANVIGSVRVFEATAAAGVPALVYASSVGAYSPGPKDTMVDESWPTHGWPAASYTREKAYLERVLDGFEAQHPDVRVVRMRPGFLFQWEAASEQRRLFAGPLLPQRLVRPSMIPVVPDLPGLRMQVLHTDDAALAYRLAALDGHARGAYNLATEPVLDAPLLAELLGARVVPLPVWALRGPLVAAWRLHLTPADPDLFDAVLRLPLMDSTRARDELGWTPRYDAATTVGELLAGMRDVGGLPTPPLEPTVPGGRAHELRTGPGSTP